MLLPVLLAVILAFIATGTIIYSTVKKDVTALAEENSWFLANNIAETLKRYLTDALNTVNTTVEMAHFAANLSFEEKEFFDYLKQVADIHGFFAISVVWDHRQSLSVSRDKTGNLAERYPDAVQMATQSWYIKTMKSDGKKALVSEPFFYDFGNGPVKVIIVTRAIVSHGKNTGFVGVIIDAEQVFKQIDGVKLYDTGYAYLMLPDHTIMAHPIPGNVGTKSRFADQVRARTDNKETFSLPAASLTTGKMSDYYFLPVAFPMSDDYYYVGLSVPEDEMLRQVYHIRNVVALIAVLAMLAISGVVFALVRRLVKLLGGEPEYVISSVNEVAKGNFAYEPELKKNDRSSIIYYLKSMVEQLHTVISRSIGISEELRTASSSLSSGAHELSTGMTDQAVRTEQISSAATEMSTATSDIAHSVEEIAEFTNITAKNIGDGVAKVESSLEEINKIKYKVDQASIVVEGLEAKSSEISFIVETIDTIADQTNLLSLNATIEAARAGEAGRGFAVVADEVRKLAEKTQKATSEITTLISDIRQEVVRVSDSMTDVNQQVDHGINASRGIHGILTEIDQVVIRLKDMINNISGATQEMSTTTDQIQKDISDIAVVSNQVRTTTDYLAENASNLDKISDTLRDMMRRFKI